MYGWFLIFICFLVGVDRDILARCPPRDRGNVLTIGWLLIGVWVWQLVVISVALHVGLAQPGEVRPDFIALAALVATLVLLFDSYLVRASWQATGEEQLARAGLRLPAPWGAKLKGVAFMAVRAGVTVLLALLTGSLMSLMLFKKDIEGQITAVAAQRNAPLVQTIERRVDAEAGRLTVERGQVIAALGKADADASALRQGVLNQLPADPEIGLATDRIRDLTRRRDVAERRLAQLRRVSTGNQEGDGTGRLSAARRNLDAVDRDLAGARDRLASLQARREASAERLNGTIEARLGDIKATRAAAEARLGELDRAIATRGEAREALIRAALVRDPAYVPADDGLLARLKALKALTVDPFIFWIVLLLDAVFVAIELAAVLSKVMTFVPAGYALTLVTENTESGQLSKERLARVLGLDAPAEPPVTPVRDPRQAEPRERPPASSMPGQDTGAVAGDAQAARLPDDRDAENEGSTEPDLDQRLSDGARAAQARMEELARRNAKPKPAASIFSDAEPPPAPLPDDVLAPLRRGPGRPAGSRNKPRPNGEALATENG